jgi:hypothetical protein
MPTDEHSSWPYRRAAANLKAQRQQPCVLCDQWIDYALVAPEVMRFAAEHVVPVRHGGTWREGLLPSHMRCQNEQGGRVMKGIEDVYTPRSSGVW